MLKAKPLISLILASKQLAWSSSPGQISHWASPFVFCFKSRALARVCACVCVLGLNWREIFSFDATLEIGGVRFWAVR